MEYILRNIKVKSKSSLNLNKTINAHSCNILYFSPSIKDALHQNFLFQRPYRQNWRWFFTSKPMYPLYIIFQFFFSTFRFIFSYIKKYCCYNSESALPPWSFCLKKKTTTTSNHYNNNLNKLNKLLENGKFDIGYILQLFIVLSSPNFKRGHHRVTFRFLCWIHSGYEEFHYDVLYMNAYIICPLFKGLWNIRHHTTSVSQQFIITRFNA